MGNLYHASNYKNKIINLLLRNKNFVKLINPTPSESDYLDLADVLLGGEWIIDGKRYKEQGHVFDFNFVDETTTEQKTFVFVETDIDSVRDNMFTDFNLYICVFTAKELVRITDTTTPTVADIKNMGYFSGTYANRIDVLCDIVDDVLNGNTKFPGIGTVKPSARGFCTLYTPSSKYYGKCLKYQISNYNETEDACAN